MAREIRIEGDVAYVPLTKGYEAIIDAADVPLVAGTNWHARVAKRRDGSVRTVYAARDWGDVKQQMHRLLLNAPSEVEVDHEDCNGLNNRRANLRVATRVENSFNRRIRYDSTSGAKGVTWLKPQQKWMAQIRAHGTPRYLGLFESLEDAKAAYDEASARLHGAFGRAG